MTTLGRLIAAVPGARLAGPPADPEVGWVVYRSDAARVGAIFACLRGVSADGHDFAADALARGASALIVERELPLAAPQLVVPDARLAMALVAAELSGNPSRDLTVVGVTGTNGKTTTAFLMRSVLEAAGVQCGLLGTVEARVGGVVEPVRHTTPESPDLQETLARMRIGGDGACAMEVSSHALAQHRVAGVRFAAAIFTNLTRDHLDYHPTVEDYYLAKRALFIRREGEGADPPGAVNLDDEHGRRLAGERSVLGFAIDHAADVRPRSLTLGARGFSAEVDTPRGPVAIESRMRGRFNVENVLGVVAAAELLGLPHAAVAEGILRVAGVPGRVEPVEAGQPFEVLVDYAHTPDSLENVLATARELAGAHRLIVTFGCGGDRDRGKRPLMGAAARRLADVCVVTSDNPRSEPPDAIIEEILAGAGDGPAQLLVEPDRRAAIALAVGLAEAGDVVVVAGKGHERGQEVKGVVTPFDDREIARDVLSELGYDG